MALEMMQAVESEMRDEMRSAVEEICDNMNAWNETGPLSLEALIMTMTDLFVKSSIDLATQGEVNLLYFDEERCKAAMDNQQVYNDLYDEIMDFVGYNDVLGSAFRDLSKGIDYNSFEKMFIQDLIECLKTDNTFIWMHGCEGVDYIHSPLQEVW